MAAKTSRLIAGLIALCATPVLAVTLTERIDKAELEAKAAANAAARCEYAAEEGGKAATGAARDALAKTADECRLLKNTGNRALYAVDRARAALVEPKPEPEKPAEEPKPAPLPSITVEGRAASPSDCKTAVTRSGHWKSCNLAALSGPSRMVMLMTRDEAPGQYRVMVAQAPTLVGEPDAKAAVPVLTRVTVGDWSADIATVRGGLSVAETGLLVEPNPDWLRAAMRPKADGSYTTVPVNGSVAHLGRPFDPQTMPGWDYDPASIGGTGSSYSTAANGFVLGLISGAAGEAPFSRGFYSDPDAQVLELARRGRDNVIKAGWQRFIASTYYGLKIPTGGIWSFGGHIVRDPMYARDGDKPYEIAIAGIRNRADIDSIHEDQRSGPWQRDPHHMLNTAWVHWLATEDPIAGIALNAQLAWHMGTFYENLRAERPGYMVSDEQERGWLNGVGLVWKCLTVAKSIGREDTMLWGLNRMERVLAEVKVNLLTKRWNGLLHRVNAQRPATSGSKWPVILYGQAVSGMLDNYNAGQTSSGPKGPLKLGSSFTMVAYQGAPWLFAMAGDKEFATIFRHQTRWVALRLGRIGGAMGAYPAGSGFPIVPADPAGGDGAVLPDWTTPEGYADWVVDLYSGRERKRDSYAGGPHYILSMASMLNLAKIAVDAGKIGPVPYLDMALEKHAQLLPTVDKGPREQAMLKHAWAAID